MEAVVPVSHAVRHHLLAILHRHPQLEAPHVPLVEAVEVLSIDLRLVPVSVPGQPGRVVAIAVACDVQRAAVPGVLVGVETIEAEQGAAGVAAHQLAATARVGINGRTGG